MWSLKTQTKETESETFAVRNSGKGRDIRELLVTVPNRQLNRRDKSTDTVHMLTLDQILVIH